MEKILTDLIERGEKFEFNEVQKLTKVPEFWARYYDPKPYSVYVVDNPDEYTQWKADVIQCISLYHANERSEYEKLFRYSQNHSEILAKLRAIKKIGYQTENKSKMQNQEKTTRNIVYNNYGSSNNVSIGNNNQNKQETTENQNDSENLSWTKAGVVVAIISIIVAIIIGVVSNWEKIFR